MEEIILPNIKDYIYNRQESTVLVDRWIHSSMEKNRESGDRPVLKHANDSWQKHKSNSMGTENFPTNGTGIIRQPSVKRKKLNPHLTPYTKTKLKMNHGLKWST